MRHDESNTPKCFIRNLVYYFMLLSENQIFSKNNHQYL